MFFFSIFNSRTSSPLPVHDAVFMLFPNNTLGPVEPWLCVKAHCGGDDGGRGRVGWVCVFTQLSSGLTQVSLHKYHTHTLSPTVDMMCVQSHSCIPRYFTYRAWLSLLDRRGECDLKIEI